MGPSTQANGSVAFKMAKSITCEMAKAFKRGQTVRDTKASGRTIYRGGQNKPNEPGSNYPLKRGRDNL